MGNAQGVPVQQQDRLPYQGGRPQLDTITPRQADPSAAAMHGYEPQTAADLEERPVYEWVLRRAAQVTRGVARVDLVRPRLPALSEDGALWRAGDGDGRVGYPSVRGGGAYSRMRRQDFGGGGGFAQPEHGRLRFGAARGARIKLMRCIDFGGQQTQRPVQPSTGAKPITAPFGDGGLSDGLASPGVLGKVAGAFEPEPAWKRGSILPPVGTRQPLMSLGIGGSFEMDTLRLEPALRFRFQDWLTIKLMPAPVLKLQKSLRLPNSPLSLRLRYEVPLNTIEDSGLLRPPARLLIRLDNSVGSGIHLSPSGIDFDQRVLRLGSAQIRAKGSARFPRQLPVPEGKPLLDWEVDRLGLKTSW